MSEKSGGFISKIIFNDQTVLEIQEDSIIVFVGPNNSGKSQTLKDIYNLSKKKIPSVVVSDIEINKNNLSISGFLNNIATGEDQGGWIEYHVLGNEIRLISSADDRFLQDPFYGNYRNLFIASLDTSARLNICEPANSIPRNSQKSHPIHYAEFEQKYRKWLSDNFKKAFGSEVIPNNQYGSIVPLCIGPSVNLEGKFADEQERLEKYADILDSYDQVQNQGDGIKSFTGILLYLMLDYFRTYLIDEPESFLHPPQAHIMGQIIGQTLTDHQQAFISTHSEEIIKGLMEVCPERITLIRITRKNNSNNFSILKSEQLNDIWSDPLLKYSNIMSSLFHKSVVLCESDSDCKMYSIIENHLKKLHEQYSEVLFVHCGGKQRMSKIAAALKSLDIDIKLIVDIDVLDNEKTFQNILQSFNIDWDKAESFYKRIVANIQSQQRTVNRSNTKTLINSILDKSTEKDLSKSEIKEIQEVIKTSSKWTEIKKGGISALPPGDASSAFSSLDTLLRDNGIYIVPVGELEYFVREVGGHGPEWVNRVLETYPDLENDVYSSIKDFIGSMKL